MADLTPQTAPAAPVLGMAGVTSAPECCARCDRPRLPGVGWCGTWCRRCLAGWIADGQPAPARAGGLGRIYRLQHDGPVSA